MPQVLGTVSAKQVDKLKNPKADLTNWWGPDARKSAVEALGFGHDLCHLKVASEQEAYDHWLPETDDTLKKSSISLYSTSTTDITAARAKATEQGRKQFMMRVRGFEKAGSKCIIKSKAYVSESSDEEMDEDNEDKEEDDSVSGTCIIDISICIALTCPTASREVESAREFSSSLVCSYANSNAAPRKVKKRVAAKGKGKARQMSTPPASGDEESGSDECERSFSLVYAYANNAQLTPMKKHLNLSRHPWQR